jgi:hypothetical protein
MVRTCTFCPKSIREYAFLALSGATRWSQTGIPKIHCLSPESHWFERRESVNK